MQRGYCRVLSTMGPSRCCIIALILWCTCVSVEAQCSNLEQNCELIEKPFSSVREEICSQPAASFIEYSPPEFTIEPVNFTGPYLNQPIIFKCALSASDKYQLNFAWELNGEVLNESRFEIESDGNSSTIKVLTVDRGSEGSYRCLVTSQLLNYTMSSRYGHLKLQSTPFWEDIVPDNQFSTEYIVNVSISKGATTILECSLNNGPVVYNTVWLRNKHTISEDDLSNVLLPNGALLVRDFEPESETVQYLCIIVSTSSQLNRTFNLFLTDGEPSAIVPSNKTAVLGSRVTLYCVTDNKTPNMWTINDASVDSSSGITLYGDYKEVLVVESVASTMEGLYGCRSGSGFVNTAHVRVIVPPATATIEASGYNTNSNILLLQPAVSHSLNLSCITDISDLEMSYSWFFRGAPLADKEGVITEGSKLMVTGAEVLGSYQCIAENTAGSVSTALFVHLDKPPPPSDVSLHLGPQISYQYNYRILPPANTEGRSPTYSVELYIHRTTDAYFTVCRCSFSDNIGAGGVGALAFEADRYIGYDAYFRVASVDASGAVSDFVAYYEDPATCGTRIENIAPPNPGGLRWTPSVISDQVSTVVVDWTTPSDEHYPFRLYSTHLTLDCTDRDKTTTRLSSHSTSYKFNLTSCADCEWTVSFTTTYSDSYPLSSSVTSNNSLLPVPVTPPLLNAVSRVNSNGRELNLQFSIPLSSCVYNEFQVLINNNEHLNCPAQPSPGAGNYSCSVSVSERYCWQPLTVSIVYGSSESVNGLQWSRPSEDYTVEGVSTGELAERTELSVKSLTPNSLSVLLEFTGIDCVSSNSPWATIQVCISSPLSATSCQAFSKTVNTFNSLQPNTNYTVQAIIMVGLESENFTLSINTKTSLADTESTSGPKSTPSTISTQSIVAAVLAIVCGISVLMIIVLVTCCILKVRSKKRGPGYKALDRRQLLHASDEQLNDEELVSPGPDGAPSIRSEHTEYDKFSSLPEENCDTKCTKYLDSVCSEGSTIVHVEVEYDNTLDTEIQEAINRNSSFGAEHLETSPIEAAQRLSNNSCSNGESIYMSHRLPGAASVSVDDPQQKDGFVNDTSMSNGASVNLTDAPCAPNLGYVPNDTNLMSSEVGDAHDDNPIAIDSGYVLNNSSSLSGDAARIDEPSLITNFTDSCDFTPLTPISSGYVESTSFNIPRHSTGFEHSTHGTSSGYVASEEIDLDTSLSVGDSLSQDSVFINDSQTSKGSETLSIDASCKTSDNGYFTQSGRHYTQHTSSSSEGYVSARATPSHLGEEFTKPSTVSENSRVYFTPSLECCTALGVEKTIPDHINSGLKDYHNTSDLVPGIDDVQFDPTLL